MSNFVGNLVHLISVSAGNCCLINLVISLAVVSGENLVAKRRAGLMTAFRLLEFNFHTGGARTYLRLLFAFLQSLL